MKAEILRRHFVAVATTDYEDDRFAALPRVREEVQALQQWLCAEELGARRFVPRYPELAANPDENALRVLKKLAFHHDWNEGDAAVLFVTGHGARENNTHYLVLHDSHRNMLATTAVRTADLISWLLDTDVQHMMIILDVCFASAAHKDVLALSTELRPNWLVLPSVARDQKAVVGALTAAITQFLEDLQAPTGRRYGENPYIDVTDFVTGVQTRLGPTQTVRPLGWVAGPHVCLPNPHYRPDEAVEVAAARHDLALPRQDVQTHWGPRARGVASNDQPGWLFTGRAALMRQLIAAATGNPAATLVTGGAGSGKSAALARLVTLSDPQFLAHHAADVVAIPADLRPEPCAVDVAMVATGKLHTQILAQLCHALQVPPPPTDHTEPTVTERLAAWHRWLTDRQRPVTIVIDALDEAADPRTLLADVLTRLEPDLQTPQIRLLVGVRSLAAGEDPAANPGTGSLTELVETTLHARAVRVDEAPWWDQDDVVAYVDSILHHSPASPYAAAGPAARREVAAALGKRAGRSFLIARIAAAALAARETVTAADDPGWLTALDQGVLGVFRQDLHHTVTDPRKRRAAVILLRAVAFAYGAGMPWRHIWPPVAHAVDDEGGHYGDDQIADLLNSRLGAYLVTTTEDGTTAYRLFHDLLRSTLRDRWHELLAAPGDTDPDPVTDHVAVEARIACELARPADVPVTVDCDQPPPPYVRRHLAEHAAAGGVLDDRTIPDAFLPYLDPVRLRAAAARPPSGMRGPSSLRHLPTIRQVTHRWDWDQPAHNATQLSLTAGFGERPFAQPLGGAWHVRWAASFAGNDLSEVLTVVNGAVAAVATAVLSNGQVVAITGDLDGVLRVWDAAAGTSIGGPLTGHTGVVSAVATAVEPDGRVVAVTGDSDGTVRIWGLATGTALGETLTGHTSAISGAVTAAMPDGRRVAVTSDSGGAVRAWDLVTTKVAWSWTHTSAISALATATLPDGRVVAVTGDSDGTVRTWDLATGTALGQPLTGHTSAISALATTTLPDGRVVAVTASEGGSVRVWDVAAGTAVWQLLHTSGVSAVATAVLADGRPIAVTGDHGGAVRIWDLATDTDVDEPRNRHRYVLAAPPPTDVPPPLRLDATIDGEVLMAVATADLPDGRPVAVTYPIGSPMQVWDLTAGVALEHELIESAFGVLSVATGTRPDGRVVAVTGDCLGTVMAWDLTDLNATGQLLGRLAHEVQAVATGALPDGRLVVVSGDSGGEVRVWEVTTAPVLGRRLARHTSAVTAVATAVLRDGRLVAVTATQGGSVRVWDVTAQTVVGRPSTKHTSAVTAVATAALPDGRIVAVTAAEDGVVRVWDLATGVALDPPLAEHTTAVGAVVTAVLPDQRPVVITGDADGVVQVWDLVSRIRIARSSFGFTIVALGVHAADTPRLVVCGAGLAFAELLL